MGNVKIALIQQKYHSSKEKTIKATVDFIKKASEKANLIVLQELHQQEYFCQSEDIKFFDYANSFEQDKKFWSNISQKFNIVLVTSLFEKRARGLYHNSVVVFDCGKEVGIYRKMHIPDDPNFYEKFYFTPGDLGFKPIETTIGKLGVLICWDQWYPEAARIMALNGADILIYPTAIGWFDSDIKEEKQKQLDAWINIQRSHAIANGLPVVSVNRVGFENDSSGISNGIRFWGNSFVCGVQGEFIVRGSKNQEEILYATIDFNKIDNIRKWWPFFRDRRIDSYSDILKRFSL